MSGNRSVKRKSGAVKSKATASSHFSSYLTNHKEVAVSSLQRLLKTPLSSLMTWLVIAIALSLPCALFIAINNLSVVSSGWDGSAQISLYLNQNLSDQQTEKVIKAVSTRPDVDKVLYVSPEAALKEFQRLSGFGKVLDHLDSNPLPGVLVVTPSESKGSPEQLSFIYKELKELKQVDRAVVDMQWVHRLYALMSVIKRMAYVLAILLSLGVLLVIGNTIRLAIENRRDEILVVKLVGGADGFVRRPFLYTGFWYGFGGGLLALMIIAVSLLWLSAPAKALAASYGSSFELLGLSFFQSVCLMVLACLLGLMGAWLSVARHLGDIEPK